MSQSANANRRQFLGRATVTTAAAALTVSGSPRGHSRVARPTVAPANLPSSPVARRTLGQTGIEVSLIGLGTGSNGTRQASNQTRLGVKEFTRIVRHALDSGITFFDVADQYGSHTYLRAALKGVPRESYTIQTKTHARNLANCRSHVERYLMELGVDYIDNLLLHCMTKAGWQRDYTGAMEYLQTAKQQGLIRAHGTSCHGMAPLKESAQEPWVEVDLARINPEGKYMDGPVDQVVDQLQIMHASGKGVIGMKVMGQGEFAQGERRDDSLRYVLGLGCVDAFVTGFESTQQIDDLLARTGDAIAFLQG